MNTLLMVLLVSVAASAQQQPPMPTPEQMKAMLAEMQPGPEHRVLASLEGRWTLDVTYNMGGPKSKPMTALNVPPVRPAGAPGAIVLNGNDTYSWFTHKRPST